MRLVLWNLVVYSAQLAVLVAAAALAQRALPLRVPAVLLRYWQLCMTAAVLLPFVQPWTSMSQPPRLLSTLAVADVSPASGEGGRSFEWWSVLAIVVAAGIAFRAARLVVGGLRLNVIISHAAPSHITAPGADVLVTDEIDSPATVGWRRPRILLPSRTLAMSPAAREAIVAHELVHIERGDWLCTIAEEVWCAVLWFHPGARALAAQLSFARETVVDDVTIRRTRNRRAYAEALLAFANPQQYIIGATPLIGRRSLRQRISLIAEEVPMSRRRATSHLTASVAVVSIALTAMVLQLPLSSRLYAQAEVQQPGNGVTLPFVVHEVKPVYTREAKEHKIQGSVQHARRRARQRRSGRRRRQPVAGCGIRTRSAGRQRRQTVDIPAGNEEREARSGRDYGRDDVHASLGRDSAILRAGNGLRQQARFHPEVRVWLTTASGCAVFW